MKNINSFPLGYLARGIKAKISYKKSKKDMALFYSLLPATAGAVFTSSQVKAAPIRLTEEYLLETRGRARVFMVNSGSANAATGPVGFKDARQTTLWASELLNVPQEEVWVASTGVIGPRLPMKRFRAGLKKLVGLLKSPREGDHLSAAEAIMTTDTIPKMAGLTFKIDGVPVRLWGCAKGSGMIHPALKGPRGKLHATMLGFILTDAQIASLAVQRALEWVTDRSFNCVSIDGDTSTNDFVGIMANGASGAPLIHSPQGKNYKAFRSALMEICDRLTNLIAMDGEGASRMVQIFVGGARSDMAARKMAAVIASSPLVKTACHGADPNWGRVLMALGRSGVPFNPQKVKVWIGDTLVCLNGMEYPFSEKKVIQYMRNKRIVIRVDLGLGKKWARYKTCDFTGHYVGINAGYRT